jgi:hypothetical protein
MGIDSESNFGLIRDDILVSVNSIKQLSDRQFHVQATQLADLQKGLNQLLKEHSVVKRQTQIIKSLYFLDLRRRFDQITDAQQHSNEWIFDSSLTTFTDWIESDGVNDGLFYIFGKVFSIEDPSLSH